jgi:hypothetical protein
LNAMSRFDFTALFNKRAETGLVLAITVPR